MSGHAADQGSRMQVILGRILCGSSTDDLPRVGYSKAYAWVGVQNEQ